MISMMLHLFYDMNSIDSLSSHCLPLLVKNIVFLPLIQTKINMDTLYYISLLVPYAFCRMKELQIFKDMDLKKICLIMRESFRRFV